MKRRIKAWLQRLGWYEKIRYSAIMRLYKIITRHPEIIQHQKEIRFYQSFLPSNVTLIFDIGAHHGFKTAAFLELGGNVIACDPDPHSIRILEQKFKKKTAALKILPLALGAREGKSNLYIHHEGSAFNTLNPRWKEILEKDTITRWNEEIQFEPAPLEVPVTTLDVLIQQYGRPGFIKIDAEGFEKEILAGLHHPIPFLSFECLMPDFQPEIEYSIHHLLDIDPNCAFNISIDETLLFPEFVLKDEIMDWLRTTTTHHFEMIVKTPVEK